MPVTMYRSFRLLQNPRKFMVFDLVCSKGKLTTKDLEASTGLSLSYVNDTLRELDELKLAKFEGQSAPLTADGRKTVREGDLEEAFKCYSVTEHGRLMHTLCRAYDSEKPLANLSGALDPRDVVESFAKLEKEQLGLMLNRFRDMYYLGAVLISLFYQPDASASSNRLSDCLSSRLWPNEIDELLKNYTGEDGLVLAEHGDYSVWDRLFMSLGDLFKGRLRTRRWLSRSRSHYTLTSEGERVADKLADQFDPDDLGVDPEYLHPESLEAEEGTLGQNIVLRIGVIGLFVYGVPWLWQRILQASDLETFSVRAAALAADLTLLTLTIRGLRNRLEAWRDMKRQANGRRDRAISSPHHSQRKNA